MSLTNIDSFSTFGDYLVYLRHRARMTQRELGAAVGYSVAQITRLERNQRPPNPMAVRARFIEALDLQHEPRLVERLLELAESSQRALRQSTNPRCPGKTNVQVPLTRLVGREDELIELRQLLEDGPSRLVTLAGFGGVGKTRLAIELGLSFVEGVGCAPPAKAPRFPDGVWLVELAPLNDSRLAPGAVARALQLRERACCSAAQAVRNAIADKRLLLILDNCEHMTGACAELVESLLAICPRLCILATSREPLRARSEVVWRVQPLRTPDPLHLPPLDRLSEFDSVQLFIQQAVAAQPSFELTPDSMRAAAEICARLDGIPLAIEMAATRLQVMSIDAIASRLDERFQLLTNGWQTALPRHRTLRASLDWSYDLLTPAQKLLLQRLSVFAGEWTLEMAEAVCAEEAEPSELRVNGVLPELFELVNKSLVYASLRQGQERYHLLETTRDYAGEKLAVAGDVERMRQRHTARLST